MSLGFTADARTKLKNDEIKHQLLDLVTSEKNEFSKIADTFYNKEHHNDADYIEFCQAVIKAIDTILDGGDWNDSLFLRNTVKPLQKMREQAQQLLEQANNRHTSEQVTAPTLEAGKVAVFISLFQNDGHNLRKWEMQLRSIKGYLLGRPVYQNEADVQKVIRAKLAPVNEAYITVALDQGAIRNPAHQLPRVDRYGNQLLTLAEGAVTPDKILEFVHAGKRYCFSEGQLVLQQGVN